MYGLKVRNNTTHEVITTMVYNTMTEMKINTNTMRMKYTNATIEEYYNNPNHKGSKPVTTIKTFH